MTTHPRLFSVFRPNSFGSLTFPVT